MRFLIENGLQSTVLQSDGENAILELLTEITRQLPHAKIQTSPPHSHQSQGCVEHYHQTLFAQLKTIKLSICQQCNLGPRNISSHSPLLNHLVHYTTWLLNATARRHTREI
eukprot:2468408-Amphidinium_carterae.2